MQIKLDPISKLWCRSDGAILMPPGGIKYKSFRWTFGSSSGDGYKAIQFQRKVYKAHQIICRAFNGLAPEGKPFVDHINRIKDDNRSINLHWVSIKENCGNADRIDQSIAKYGVRHCDDLAAYGRAHRELYPERHRAYRRAYYESHREECKAYSRAYRAAHH